MKCLKPFLSGNSAYGCGQCQACRAKRRRVWAHRIMLEAMCHEKSSFVTLTYKEAPSVSGLPTLVPEHLQLWLKRFRRSVAPRKVRYFAVGEYGDRTGRPHFHLALFGHACEHHPFYDGGCECITCSAVRETWGSGHILVASLTEKSARYIAGYVAKSMTCRDDIRLQGRHPEFARMSLRPGIGADAMADVASTLLQYDLHKKLLDVPPFLRHNRNLLPLGRYLRQRLRKQIGRDAKAPHLVETHKEALQLLRSFAWNSGRSVSSVFKELNPQRVYEDRGTL